LTSLPTRSAISRFLLREVLLGAVLCLAGLLLARLLHFPDTGITVGIGSADRNGSPGRVIILDFDTPTVDQLQGHASIEDFDAWISTLVAEDLPDAGQLPVVRVPSLAEAGPDTVLQYTIPWSGFQKLKLRMVPPQRGFVWETWGTVILPYAGTTLVRMLARPFRKRAR
jgi:hypothetical protein